MGGPYKNPPIIEVVCEFRFESHKPWDLTYPGLLYERLRDTFPLSKTRRRFRGTATQDTENAQAELQFMELAQFLREDEKAFVQIAPELLSVNQLKPYPEWETYKPLIARALQDYTEVMSPVGLRRIGLRYVNRIEIPERTIELDDYLLFYPHINSAFSRNMTSFLVVTQLEYAEHTSALNLRVASATPGPSDNIAIMLDLDYFSPEPLPMSVDGALDWVETAHTIIEEAFEACITDKTRALFNQESEVT